MAKSTTLHLYRDGKNACNRKGEVAQNVEQVDCGICLKILSSKPRVRKHYVRRLDVPLSIERARSVFTYDEDTGFLLRRSNGKRAGFYGGPGYRQVSIDTITYLEHRLIWFLVHGVWPEKILDHINGDRSDNRLANLRESDIRANALNKEMHRKGRVGGVSVSPQGKFVAMISHNKKSRLVGSYDDKDMAKRAYENAASLIRSGCELNEAVAKTRELFPPPRPRQRNGGRDEPK